MRITGALLKSLKKRPLDYFKQDFYADTAVFTSDGATELGMKFYPLEKIVFASDCPFDPEKGTMYIRETLRIIDALESHQGAARSGLLQEPGADHREDVCEVSTFWGGPGYGVRGRFEGRGLSKRASLPLARPRPQGEGSRPYGSR